MVLVSVWFLLVCSMGMWMWLVLLMRNLSVMFELVLFWVVLGKSGVIVCCVVNVWLSWCEVFILLIWWRLVMWVIRELMVLLIVREIMVF